MRNLIGVADGVKLSESAPFGLALGQSDTFSADFSSERFSKWFEWLGFRVDVRVGYVRVDGTPPSGASATGPGSM